VANIKSAIKRINTTKRQTERNLSHRTKVKTYVKKLNEAIASTDETKMKEAYITTIKVVDKVAGKGIIHKNKAARIKSRMAKKINKLVAPVAPAIKKTKASAKVSTSTT